MELWGGFGYYRFYCSAQSASRKNSLHWCSCPPVCDSFADCNAPGTEDNPIANRPCLPILNQVVNYTQPVIKLALAVANIGLGVEFIRALSAAKIKNVVRGGGTGMELPEMDH